MRTLTISKSHFARSNIANRSMSLQFETNTDASSAGLPGLCGPTALVYIWWRSIKVRSLSFFDAQGFFLRPG